MGGETPSADRMSPSQESVVWITGAAGGLGSVLVDSFSQAGWRVAAGWHRTALTTVGERILPVKVDVTDPESPVRALDLILQKWGRLDVLINNAGIARDNLVPRMSLQEWQEVLDVNLKGAFRCAQIAVRPMMRQREGQIINITSHGGKVGRAGQANYSASKAALFGFTQSLAREVGSRNVRVNAVSPGFLKTPLVDKLTEDQLSEHAAANALGRLNESEEVARFLVFLAGTRNISGQIFQLDSRITTWS